MNCRVKLAQNHNRGNWSNIHKSWLHNVQQKHAFSVKATTWPALYGWEIKCTLFVETKGPLSWGFIRFKITFKQRMYSVICNTWPTGAGTVPNKLQLAPITEALLGKRRCKDPCNKPPPRSGPCDWFYTKWFAVKNAQSPEGSHVGAYLSRHGIKTTESNMGLTNTPHSYVPFTLFK